MVRKYFWPLLAVALVGIFFAARWLLDALPLDHVDLEVYRFGLQAWWHGEDIYGTLPVAADGSNLPFVYPPLALLFLAPLAMVSAGGAITIMIVLDFLALAVTLYVVSRRIWPSSGVRGATLISLFALPLTVFLEPVFATFELGQVSLILMAVVVVDCLAPKTWWPRGMGIGIAAAIKLAPLAFLLFFLIRKDFRATTIAVITAIAASLVGFLVDASASVKYWFGGAIGEAGSTGSVFRNNQATTAVFARMGLPSGLATALWILFAVIVLALVIIAMRKTEPVLALMANAGFTLLASPTSWSHYWVWLVPTLLMMIGYIVRRWQERSPAVSSWVAAALLTFALCYLAPFLYMPATNFRLEDLPASWSIKEQIMGASYVLLGLGLLIAYVVPKMIMSRKPHDLQADFASSWEMAATNKAS